MFLFNKIREKLVGCVLTISYSISKDGNEVISNSIDNSNSVGDIIEQVVGDLFGHMLEKGPPNKSPDYYTKNSLTFIESQTVNQVEVKTFENSPNFDIGNFDAYVREISTESGLKRKLFETIYLIIEYESVTKHLFRIKNVWAKNVWQLPNYEGKYPLTLQVKQNRPHNIRPGCTNSWDDGNKTPSIFIDGLNMCIEKWSH
jgi:hypothetical protein